MTKIYFYVMVYCMNTKPIYESERNFLKHADKNKTYIYAPQWFYIEDGTKYMPDFYCVEDKTYIEVSASYCVYHANKHKYEKMRLEHPKIKFKIVLPDGRDCNEKAQITKKGLSRQRAWQLRKRKEGNCEQCGKPALKGFRGCLKCIRKNRIRIRKRLGCKPRKKYGRGRPILSV